MLQPLPTRPTLPATPRARADKAEAPPLSSFRKALESLKKANDSTYPTGAALVLDRGSVPCEPSDEGLRESSRLRGACGGCEEQSQETSSTSALDAFDFLGQPLFVPLEPTSEGAPFDVSCAAHLEALVETMAVAEDGRALVMRLSAEAKAELSGAELVVREEGGHVVVEGELSESLEAALAAKLGGRLRVERGARSRR